ncbi:MAG: hypothetical protein IPK44_04620 [Candidatus Accumulibacter sp.]|uniref:hypothetical protein n=1 Tax=Accumulibacter sp. TaxID=2053492 RepID=UPI0025883D63|nr:hypothetical protein [Accumulibacter sp.]MBK8113871.1 hypothetical protein [Accumulibacter sp.]
MKLTYISYIALMCLFQAPAFGDTPNFQDGFEEGLGNWHPNQERIEIVGSNCFEGSKCVRIERENGRGYTYIGRVFRVPSRGTLRIEAKIRAEGVVPGVKNYQRGKFVAVVIENGKEVDWPNADFEGTISQWVPRAVTIPDLDPSIDVDMRIGLQNAKGVVFVDDVKAFFTPR